ncbi:hypothetical protein [Azonexus sp.]|uniref:hypothetical protein n=1 Tax=Azonexus sp. TaxID=1872668 RepID=UPI0035B33812
MPAPRRFALVLLLCLAPLVALLHELAHARDDVGEVETCAICLVAHVLAAALPPASLPIGVPPVSCAVLTWIRATVLRAEAPQPTQRGPPTA